MFVGKMEGIRLLKDGTTSVMLTCSGDDMQAIANLRRGNIICYGESESPVQDSRAAVLANIRSLAEQVAEAIGKELEPMPVMTKDLFTQGVSDE